MSSVTAASSCYARDPVSGREVGWIPMLRGRGAQIRDLVAVISRRQGGEENLAGVGVRVRSLAVVDETFLAAHSRHPEQAVAYYRDPEEWTRGELLSRGTGFLLGYLSEDPKKLPRLLKLAKAYRPFLEAEGLWLPASKEEALQQLVEHPLHRAAKDLQGRWIRGYHITIAQVLRSYGDGGIAHPLGAMPSGHE